jgi:hypothetical protein
MGNVKKLRKRGKYWQITEKGADIPVPKRRDFFKDLEKAAKPETRDDQSVDKTPP